MHKYKTIIILRGQTVNTLFVPPEKKTPAGVFSEMLVSLVLFSGVLWPGSFAAPEHAPAPHVGLLHLHLIDPVRIDAEDVFT